MRMRREESRIEARPGVAEEPLVARDRACRLIIRRRQTDFAFPARLDAEIDRTAAPRRPVKAVGQRLVAGLLRMLLHRLHGGLLDIAQLGLLEHSAEDRLQQTLRDTA